MNRNSLSLALAIGFAFAALVVRFSPVPTNFALIGGLSLFCGCYLRGWIAWAIPLGCMAISDLVGHFSHVADMGFYHPATMLGVYLGFAAMTLLGTGLRPRNNASESDSSEGPVWVLGSASLGSMIFFVTSNFGSWLDPQSGYAASLNGLIECYVLALPFHRWTILSDLFSAAFFFGTYQSLRSVVASQSVSSRR